jgi:hypothetical protein
MKNLFILTLIFVASLVIPACVVVKSIRFTQECGGYLEQAANANTVELAAERLDHAIAYMEQHGLTEGYTSVLWKTEDENIGFWYRNVVACRNELSEAMDLSQLEKSNVLMKVRESLMQNHGEHGDKIIVPPGISRYPHNLGWGIARWAFWLYFLVWCIVIGVVFNDYY